ncbi:MAG: hypothetical protein M0P57_14260 [Syntrophales bacterium]|jgi:hypothetical protein|nr:hypothetical protein [Syntrophales bacterium]
MSEEKMIFGWDAIAEYFPYHTATVREKYGREMLEAGFVFKSHVGKGKAPRVWTYPSLIKSFVSMKQARNGRV